MGHTYVKATFYNANDYFDFEYVQGRRKLGEVRRLEQNALVDMGATFPALSEDNVKDLGLPLLGEYEAEVAEGKGKLKLT